MKKLAVLSILAMTAGVAAAQEQPYDDNGYDEQPGDPNDDGYDPNAQPPPPQDEFDSMTYDDGYDPNAYQQFEGALSPYGTWQNDSVYGRIWVPAPAVVGVNFVPYSTAGHWVFTDFGWTWVSDWNWGWAPFHYGRWIFRSHTWGWVPGRVWGPGWVAWRSNRRFVGWAPLPPTRVRIHDHSALPGWRFASADQLGAARIRYLAPRSVPTVMGRTRVIRNERQIAVGRGAVRYNAGPHPQVMYRAVPRGVPQAPPVQQNQAPRGGGGGGGGGNRVHSHTGGHR
jgi:uncharacterized protein DUF6600